MKKVLFAILAAMTVLFVSCDPDEAVRPTVSFETAVPIMSDGVATIRISVQNYSGEAVTVPVTFGGTAVEGTDYTVSAEAFVIGGTDPVTEIVITPLTYDSSKTISASLTAPDGFVLGQYPVIQYNMSGAIANATFRTQSAILTSSATLYIDLYDINADYKRVEREAFVEVEVDTEKSTAVEGTHFSFEGEKGVRFDVGEFGASLSLKFLSLEEGHDKIVLKIKDSDAFGLGTYPEIEISILGSSWDKLSGKWVMNELLTESDFFSMWGIDLTLDGFPEFNAEDAVTIDTENGKFIPDFKSSFKYYFTENESNITQGNEEEYTLDYLIGSVSLQVLELDNINRYFTPDEQSEDKVALVGVRIIQDENNQELLDMYLFDYNPHGCLKELNEFVMPEKPVMAMSSSYFNMTFKRAE